MAMDTQTPPNPETKPPEIKPVEQPVTYRATRPRRGQGSAKYILGALIIILLCFVAGFAGGQFSESSKDTMSSSVSQGAVKNDGNKNVTSQEATISDVVSKVAPSVVSIVTTQTSSSPFSGAAQEQSAGTGIVVSKDGYIMTNHHVVGNASTATVVLADGTSYDKVKVVGSDPLNDVAFLKISNVSNLPTAELGDSSTLRIGQQLVAIGNSLGQYQNTVTDGILSGTGRSVQASDGNGSSSENLSDLLQTNAAINPGNSGGPLLNLSGQVIGMNTAVAQDAQGIGFAIPIDATKGLLKSVLAGNGIQRSFLGVQYQPITADVAKSYNLPVKEGAYVYADNGSAVQSGSPADKAGIKNKDIITKIDGQKIGSAGGLSTIISEYTPGETVQLTILRGGQTMTVSVTLSQYSAN